MVRGESLKITLSLGTICASEKKHNKYKFNIFRLIRTSSEWNNSPKTVSNMVVPRLVRNKSVLSWWCLNWGKYIVLSYINEIYDQTVNSLSRVQIMLKVLINIKVLFVLLIMTLKDNGVNNILNPGKKIKDTRFHKHYTLKELDIFRLIRPSSRVHKNLIQIHITNKYIVSEIED
jgi:hypothetical protein